MMPMKRTTAILTLVWAAYAQHDLMNQRGDHVMGFSHDKTTHHFLLSKDGGVIQVEANDPKDTTSRDEIQMHLSHIAGMFAAGNFQAPMLVHDAVPPGVPALQRLKAEVTYRFEKTERGGRVRITTANDEALEAVHDFLKFQIADHKTGDPMKVQ
jgi:hypothetical protein